MKKILIAILSIGFVLACSKGGGGNEPNPTPNPPGPPSPNIKPEPLISSLVHPARVQVEYMKDENNKDVYAIDYIVDGQNKVTEKRYSDGGSEVITYDGNKIKNISKKNKAGQMGSIDIEYFNDKISKIKEEVFGGGETIIESYSYDTEGRVTSVYISTKDNMAPNTYVETRSFNYTGNSAIVVNGEWVHTRPGRNPKTKKSITTYKLDLDGRVIEKVFTETAENLGFSEGIDPTTIITYQYDKRGNLNYRNPVFDPRPTAFLNPYAQLNNLTRLISNKLTPATGETQRSEESSTYKYAPNEYPSEIVTVKNTGEKTTVKYTYKK